MRYTQVCHINDFINHVLQAKFRANLETRKSQTGIEPRTEPLAQV